MITLFLPHCPQLRSLTVMVEGDVCVGLGGVCMGGGGGGQGLGPPRPFSGWTDLTRSLFERFSRLIQL